MIDFTHSTRYVVEASGLSPARLDQLRNGYTQTQTTSAGNAFQYEYAPELIRGQDWALIKNRVWYSNAGLARVLDLAHQSERGIKYNAGPRLYLNLRREYFTAILAGTKTKEYRQASPHWRRLLSRQYDSVLFRNGYAKDGPRAVFGVIRIERDFRRSIYVIHLGARIS